MTSTRAQLRTGAFLAYSIASFSQVLVSRWLVQQLNPQSFTAWLLLLSGVYGLLFTGFLSLYLGPVWRILNARRYFGGRWIGFVRYEAAERVEPTIPPPPDLPLVFQVHFDLRHTPFGLSFSGGGQLRQRWLSQVASATESGLIHVYHVQRQIAPGEGIPLFVDGIEEWSIVRTSGWLRKPKIVFAQFHHAAYPGRHLFRGSAFYIRARAFQTHQIALIELRQILEREENELSNLALGLPDLGSYLPARQAAPEEESD